jgi:hypothetical protein
LSPRLSKNIWIKIHKTIILPIVLYRCENLSLKIREGHRLGVFKNREPGERLDLRGRKWREAGEDCIMRGFITYTLHQILLK